MQFTFVSAMAVTVLSWQDQIQGKSKSDTYWSISSNKILLAWSFFLILRVWVQERLWVKSQSNIYLWQECIINEKWKLARTRTNDMTLCLFHERLQLLSSSSLLQTTFELFYLKLFYIELWSSSPEILPSQDWVLNL